MLQRLSSATKLPKAHTMPAQHGKGMGKGNLVVRQLCCLRIDLTQRRDPLIQGRDRFLVPVPHHIEPEECVKRFVDTRPILMSRRRRQGSAHVVHFDGDHVDRHKLRRAKQRRLLPL